MKELFYLYRRYRNDCRKLACTFSDKYPEPRERLFDLITLVVLMYVGLVSARAIGMSDLFLTTVVFLLAPSIVYSFARLFVASIQEFSNRIRQILDGE